MRVCNYFNNTYTILYLETIIIKHELILDYFIIDLNRYSYCEKKISLPTTELLTADFPIQKKHMLSINEDYIIIRKWLGSYEWWEVHL